MRAGPYLAGTRREMHRAVPRLHRRVREERQLVFGVEFFALRQALGDVTDRFCDHPFLFARRAQMLPNIIRADARVRAFVPGDDESVETLLGGPHVIADDRDQVVEHHDLPDAGNSLGRAVVDVSDFAAEYRARGKGGELHAEQHAIDALDDLAVGLVGRIEALARVADQREILRVLERWILRHRDIAGRVDQLAIPARAPAAPVRALAVPPTPPPRTTLPFPPRALPHPH